MIRQIILDTETTGLNPKEGHKIIEIGCIELVNRKLTGNNFHYYLNPEREIDQEAVKVHGLTNQFLEKKPKFCHISEDFLEYIKDAELIAHNARFDIGFLNHELGLDLYNIIRVTDTLELAKKLHPGQKNSLDALCRRYQVDNSNRDLHGALLDANLLAEVYLAMTGGQGSFEFAQATHELNKSVDFNTNVLAHNNKKNIKKYNINIIEANEQELKLHNKFLDKLRKSAVNGCAWDSLNL